jgi:hypothetical protein
MHIITCEVKNTKIKEEKELAFSNRCTYLIKKASKQSNSGIINADRPTSPRSAAG